MKSKNNVIVSNVRLNYKIRINSGLPISTNKVQTNSKSNKIFVFKNVKLNTKNENKNKNLNKLSKKVKKNRSIITSLDS